MNERPHILLIEDEVALSDVIRDYLLGAGMRVTVLYSGTNALANIKAARPDLLILDVMLPNMDGIEICRKVRAESTIPIILETARAEEVDRILGLEIGADDYICKPFSPRELVARVKANLRRIGFEEQPIRNTRLSMDTATWIATIDSQDIGLTRREFQLLHVMVMREGRVMSRAQLIDLAFGNESDVIDRTIDSHIKNIRLKIKSVAADFEVIRSVYGVGYAAELNDERAPYSLHD